MQILPSREILLHVRQPGRITTVIPNVQTMPTRNGNALVVVPHKVDQTIVLRNLLIDVPSPILHYYDWPGTQKPFDVQVKTAAMLTINPRAFVLNALGTGKTLAALWALDFLMREGVVNSALIAAPLSTLERVWADEIYWNLPHRSFTVLHGSRAKRRELLADHKDFYIINHDGVAVVEEELLADKRISAVVIDELPVYRNRRTDRWKTLQRVTKSKRYVWGMTGTPTPNSPTDAYGQIMLVNPSRCNRSFRSFRDSVLRQVSMFKWVPKDDATDVVYSMMQPSVRFTRDECLDLPPVMNEERSAELSPQQKSAYKQMIQNLRIEHAQGEIKAVNEAAKLQKLLQISLGDVYDSEHRVMHLHPEPRLRVLQEVMEDAPAKIIVFVPFIHGLNTVVNSVRGWGYDAALVHGSVSSRERNAIFADFQRQDNPRVLVAHPQCMSHGLNLTKASVIVWYGPIWSNEIYEQANGRITRAGQQRSQLIINITATPLEERIVRQLRMKQKLQNLLLDMFKKGEPM